MDDRVLRVFRLPPVGLDFDVAPTRREWMDRLPSRFANRCLPLLMANASGWVLTQVGDVTATWDGSAPPASVHVDAVDCPAPPTGHFGRGLLTWQVPYLFRTPPGWNLLLRGPANRPKDGAAPLEGLIEADWATQTTTFTWQMTRPGTVTFTDGDLIAMVVPHHRDDLETWTPVVEEIPADLSAQVAAFRTSRDAYNSRENGSVKDWEGQYFDGTAPGGATAGGGHRRRRRLRSPGST